MPRILVLRARTDVVAELLSSLSVRPEKCPQGVNRPEGHTEGGQRSYTLHSWVHAHAGREGGRERS